MQHRGETLKKILSRLGVSNRELGRLLGRHHNTVGNYVDRADLSDKLLLEIGEKLEYDMSQDYPALAKLQPARSEPSMANEPLANYLTHSSTPQDIPDTLPACQLRLMTLQAQHISMMQDYIKLLQTTRQHQHAA